MPRIVSVALAPLLLASLLAAGCSLSSSSRSDAEVSLHPDFGTYARTVDTDDPDAQAWFDQGIQLLYGFNHDEAIRSFQRAAEIDPDCAMAWWGVAYANGLHINNPEMTEAQSQRGYEAAQEALARVDHADPVEQGLIRAVTTRYAWPVPADRRPLDEAYAAAMERLWRQHRDDPDVGALYAESLMNLQPWDLWTHDGEPKGRTLEIVDVLERVLAMRPDHPGANHFYIHAVEASNDPERAVPAAERLGGLVPGSGHLVHMPSHVWLRLGRYDDASDANQRAMEADRRYFERAPEPEFYGLYITHNIHFLTYAAMMEGRYDLAMESARRVERQIPPKFLEKYITLADGFMPTSRTVMIRFGRWEEILDEPAPPSHRLVSSAMHHYARGVAHAALGRPADARREAAEFEAVASRITDEWIIGNNPAVDVMAVARAMLEGETLFREGRYDEAFATLREGIAFEDALRYDEPPDWMVPVRHALGAMLISAGRPEEAEAVYREDLVRHPDNGWALLGLEQALRAAGGADPAELRRIADRRADAWRRADVRPTSSCYCEPGRFAGAQ